eukprot:13752791-Heterocapsa_arctica.AAC.1
MTTSLDASSCEFFNVGSKESDDEDTRTELREMRRDLRMGQDLAERRLQQQDIEIQQLRATLSA